MTDGRVSKYPQQDMNQDDVLLNAGKEQSEVIAAYLIRRMHEGRITPPEAVNIVAAHVEKQAEEMVAAGTPQQDILCWLQGACSPRSGG